MSDYRNRTEAWLDDRFDEIQSLGYDFDRNYDLDYYRERSRDAWLAQEPETEQEVHDFYCQYEEYIPELSVWTYKGDKIEQIRQYHFWFTRHGVDSVVDYGAGVGDCVLALDGLGYNPVYCDVPGPAASFFADRCDARGLSLPRYHIDSPETTVRGLEQDVDAIISNDVLEHVPDPEATIQSFADTLDTGGLCITQWTFNDHEDEEDSIYTPCHIQDGRERAESVAETMRDHFEKVDSTWNEQMRCWRRLPDR